MLKHNGKEYYSFDFSKVMKDGKTYYDRSNRHKSYFYLDFSTASSQNSVRIREPAPQLQGG